MTKFQALEQILALAKEQGFIVKITQNPDPNCLHCEGTGRVYWTVNSNADCHCIDAVRMMTIAKRKLQPPCLENEEPRWPWE